jgi:cytosine/adenosine deaminase-related metal-dependent hydrolase
MLAGRAPDATSLARWRTDVLRVHKQYFSSNEQLLTMAIAADSSYPDEYVRIARELGLRITVHVTSLGTIKALHDKGLMGPDITYVHALESAVSDEELQMIAQTGGSISSSAAVELLTANGGLISVQRWLNVGLRPSLSVDNEARIPSGHFAGMRALLASDKKVEVLRVQKAGGQPRPLNTRDVLSFATLDGARATGLAERTGSLTVGKRADLIMVDLDSLTLIPAGDPVRSFVLRAQPSDISHVMVDGRFVKIGGNMVGINWSQIKNLVNESTRHLMQAVRESGFDIRGG